MRSRGATREGKRFLQRGEECAGVMIVKKICGGAGWGD